MLLNYAISNFVFRWLSSIILTTVDRLKCGKLAQ